MSAPRVYIVHLRRPNRSDPNEQRTDPLYEFGSFGCTGCHADTLMNPDRVDRLQNARLAFAQGGKLGFRLVYLTPTINPRAFADRVEALWSPAEKPFRYAAAPVLAWNSRKGDFPLIEHLAASTCRPTLEAKFSSRFRSRATTLDPATATELVQTYDRLRARAGKDAIARTYDEALPYPPPKIDAKRHVTYQDLLKTLGVGEASGRCRPNRAKERRT